MNILTNGVHFTHADVAAHHGRLTFEIPSVPGPLPRHWWGRLERGDEISVSDRCFRVELMNESWCRIAADLRSGTYRIPRSGVVHLRLHGPGEVELQVERVASLPRSDVPGDLPGRTMALAVLALVFLLVLATAA